MQPGERVTLIKKAAQALAAQGWSDIDLTLEQFGFTTEDEWRGGEYEYVSHQLKSGSDEALANLNAYLHPGDVPPTEPQPAVVEQPDSPFVTGGFRFFLTHKASEKTNAGQLKAALEEHSIEAFVAHETIEPTKQWRDVIESGLRACDALGAWLTPGIRESDWCDQEIGFAVARGILIIPFRFGQDPYGFIDKYQALTVRSEHSFRDLARTVFDLVVKHDLSRGAMARTLVWRYETSGSYNAVRANVGYLRRIPLEAWTPGLKQQARSAHERNAEIRHAWVGQRFAPDVVGDLLDTIP